MAAEVAALVADVPASAALVVAVVAEPAADVALPDAAVADDDAEVALVAAAWAWYLAEYSVEPETTPPVLVAHSCADAAPD